MVGSNPPGWEMDSSTFYDLAVADSSLAGRSETSFFIEYLRILIYLGLDSFHIRLFNLLIGILPIAMVLGSELYSRKVYFLSSLTIGVLMAPFCILLLRYPLIVGLTTFFIFLYDNRGSNPIIFKIKYIIQLSLIYILYKLHPLASVGPVLVMMIFVLKHMSMRFRTVMVLCSVLGYYWLIYFFEEYQMPYVGSLANLHLHEFVLVIIRRTYEIQFYSISAASGFELIFESGVIFLDKVISLLLFPFYYSEEYPKRILVLGLWFICMFIVFSGFWALRDSENIYGRYQLLNLSLIGLLMTYLILLSSGNFGSFIRHFGKVFPFFIFCIPACFSLILRERSS